MLDSTAILKNTSSERSLTSSQEQPPRKTRPKFSSEAARLDQTARQDQKQLDKWIFNQPADNVWGTIKNLTNKTHMKNSVVIKFNGKTPPVRKAVLMR